MPLSHILWETKQAPLSHILGEAQNLQPRHIVEMDDSKNGGPNYLEAWRRFRGLTQEVLAEKLDTTSSVISYLEQGERGLSAKWLRRLAAVLDTTPGMILDHDPGQLDTDIIDMWARAPVLQKRQIVEISRTILKTGTGD